jgi:hypothetical protein
MTVLISLLSLAACAPAHQPQLSVDPGLLPYLSQFQADAVATRGAPVAASDLIARFATDAEVSAALGGEPNVNGACVQGPGQTPTVLISSSSFAAFATEAQRQALVYHELGHCLLGRAHDEATAQVATTQCYAGRCWAVTVPAYVSFMNHYGTVTSLTASSDPVLSHQALAEELFLNADGGPML